MAENFTLSEVEIDFDSCVYEGGGRARIYPAQVSTKTDHIFCLLTFVFLYHRYSYCISHKQIK